MLLGTDAVIYDHSNDSSAHHFSDAAGDYDHDGIPTAVELSSGFNPYDARDARGI